MKIPKILSDFVLRNTNERRLNLEAAQRDSRAKTRFSGLINLNAETLQVQTMAKYKLAVAMATDPEQPDRSYLVDLYRSMFLDNHLMSTIDSRILASQRSPFKIVNEKGEENQVLTRLLERPWHADFMRKVIFAQFQGTTLIELYDLDENGELEQITEIPQKHFSAEKGLILKEEGDVKGWEYKDGAFAKYYLQIGKNKDLGMFKELAPIVLAKKLGLGAWLDYIEKYGVPPLWISTDREDDTRMRQLLNVGLNFKRNGVVVTRGEEKVTVGNVNGAEGSGNFKNLTELANAEMSKRILGGTGTTDEKSHVGSANVHFQLAKDRFEADKLLYQHVFNAKLKPKLIALSAVYSELQNHYFEWDKAEMLSKKEWAELYATLGNNYELDTAEISESLGITILGQKNTNANPVTEKKA